MINAEVFVKYINFEKNNLNILPALAGFLSTSFGLPAPIDGIATIFDSYVNELWALTAMGDIKEDVPRAFLNYIVFDKNFASLDMGIVQVSGAAEIPEVNGESHPHERLSFQEPIEITEEGFIYIFVSNDDGQDMDVYFDDFRVTHEYGDIVAGSDFYPYGLAMEGREITRDDYRYGYQGQFAEKDEETGWNSFEARMYDPVIGRWNTIDGARQFYSPYLAMGNNPINVVDKDGNVAWFVPGLVGGAVGLGFNIAAQVSEGTFDIASGQTWARMGVAAGTGFGLAYTPGGLAGIATAGAVSGGSNVLDQVIKNGGFDNINNKEVIASTLGGAVGNGVGQMVGNSLKAGTTGGSMLINYGADLRSKAAQNAIKSALEAVGGVTGSYSAIWMNHLMNMNFTWGDNLVHGVTPWGREYAIPKGETLVLPEIVITPKD